MSCRIRKASDKDLLSITSKGIVPQNSLEKLRAAAEIAREFFADDLGSVLTKPVPVAKKDLRKFPSIGEPAAEKILLFNHKLPALALDSNGLRVLVRLGFAPEKKTYAATYKGVQEALAPQLSSRLQGTCSCPSALAATRARVVQAKQTHLRALSAAGRVPASLQRRRHSPAKSH